MIHRPAALVGRAIAVVLVVTGCSSTIDESLVSQPAATVSTTTTLPSGTAAQLLPLLVAEAADLSRRVREDDGDRDALARIEALWAASEQQVGQSHPQLLGSFEGQLAMMRRAVEFNRPADADKAYRNIDALVTSVLS